MTPHEALRQQLFDDLDRLHVLILRYANGDSAVKPERDQLEGAVQVKLALWRAVRCGFDTEL
jgi:hypothetical protein